MELGLLFLVNSIGLGIGLAMDAFSVSLANGLHEPDMKSSRSCLIAGTYAFFQYAMPMIGWLCVHTIASYFILFGKAVPWIALILLSYIGGKMIYEGIKERNRRRHCDGCEERECNSCRHHFPQSGDSRLSPGLLIMQGIATSIDALSVGFTISDYNLSMALLCGLIIAVVTFVICIAGLKIGRRAGTRLEWKASVLGGVILVAIGLEIFITNLIA